MTLKVLIIGSGLAGPSLAYWLGRLGCTVTVIERSADPRRAGQQIDIRGFGVDVMRRMGLEEAIRARCVQEPGTLIVDRRGRRRAYFATRHDGKGDTSISSEFEIMRGDMVGILEEASSKTGRVAYRYGVTVEGIEGWDEADGVRVRFVGGEEEERFDLVVGCDGLWSHTRRLMLEGQGKPDPFKPSGGAIAWVTIPREEADTKEFTWYMAPGRRIMGSRMDRDDCLRAWFATGGLDETHPLYRTLRKGSSMEQRRAWAEHFKGAGWKADRFAREIVESELAADWHCAEMGQVKMDEWYRGRVAVLGDAAYCPTPAGWGTAMALVGAYVLAGEIAKHCGLSAARAGQELSGEGAAAKARHAVPEALKSWDAKLRPLITKVQKASKPVQGLPNSKFAVSTTLFIMGMVETLKLDALMVRLANGGGTDFGWQLPEYEELGYAK
ncbi:hypothetical protein QBC47DRAFT_215468 [Echria macrotheca]|uniref:FAD-binding domain-containing protein n=1 Tax=Echria macrotheca TaxID=438768 RepID=A0AAJ0BAL4_9PEZI|nr:hypothetical protein QBC47DRAFT_215468 [Echria macrotheca]